jgi:hypothetical protein
MAGSVEMDDSVGSLEPGNYTDLVLIEQDPMEVSPTAIGTLRSAKRRWPANSIASPDGFMAINWACPLGSNADDPMMSAARPLHPAQRTNVVASLNVCVGPKAEVAQSSAGRA